MKHKAIYELYPNVRSILNDKAFDENENEVTLDMSAVNAKASELQAIEDAKPTREELRVSARAKLIAGETLTEEEANIVVI